MTWVIHSGDCIEVLAEMEPESVDAVVTDPPYGLGFMGKGWDKFKREEIAPGMPSREMVAFQLWSEQWTKLALKALKPGGHLVAFGGTRTYHRLACALEDAGFEIRDCLMWLYGSGFPKSLDVSKAIDKRPGVNQQERFRVELATAREATGLSRADVSERVVGTRSGACWNWEHHQYPESRHWAALSACLPALDSSWGAVLADAEREKVGEYGAGVGTGIAGFGGMGEGGDITAPTTSTAKAWLGWGTALKPAWEPIILARKPLAGTVAANVLEHGTGALNVDGCRVASSDGYTENAVTQGVNAARTSWEPRQARRTFEPSGSGRWPANVVLGHSPLCGRAERVAIESPYAGGIEANLEYARACMADSLARGESPIASHLLYTQPGILRDDIESERARGIEAGFVWAAQADTSAIYCDLGISGGMRQGIENARKQGRRIVRRWLSEPEKDEPVGCMPGCAVAMLDEQSGTLTSGTAVGGLHRRSNKLGANCYGHYRGERVEGDVCFGDSGGASRFFYTAKASSAERNAGLRDGGRENTEPRANHHPTVKPIALMRWLCRLVAPPGGTILDPFAGSGSTIIAALREGFSAIGIEREAEYAELARVRVEEDMPLFRRQSEDSLP